MATILPFKHLARRTLPRSPVPAGGAKIVIFPGVRYERRDGGGDDRGAPSGLRQDQKRRTKR